MARHLDYDFIEFELNSCTYFRLVDKDCYFLSSFEI